MSIGYCQIKYISDIICCSMSCMKFVRYMCCIKTLEQVMLEDDDEFLQPIIVSSPAYEYKKGEEQDDTIPLVKEKISSVYRKLSGWSLPKKSIRTNLFTLNQDDLGTHYEEDEFEEDNFDDFVDTKIDEDIV